MCGQNKRLQNQYSGSCSKQEFNEYIQKKMEEIIRLLQEKGMTVITKSREEAIKSYF